MEEVEQWRVVPDFPRYEVSTLGRVRNLETGRILKQGIRWAPVVQVRDAEGKAVARHTHRLVLLAFRGPPPPGYESRHLDGDAENNRLENLIWDVRQVGRKRKATLKS